MLAVMRARIHNPNEYKAIDDLFSVISEFTRNEVEKNNREHETINSQESIDELQKEYLSDLIIDQLSVIGHLDELCEELVAVALYKKVELSTKMIFEMHFPKKNSEDLYKFKNQKALFLKNGESIESLKGYSSVDELRVLCNAIKHQGRVTGVLAKFQGWNKGDSLYGRIFPAYTRIVNDVPEYLKDYDQRVRGFKCI